ncbi:hypothetical protein [Scytonema sp. NUACC21]
MAELIDSLLDKYFSFNDKNLIYFQPQESEKIQIDTILVQHSSGTPALSSAFSRSMSMWIIISSSPCFGTAQH